MLYSSIINIDCFNVVFLFNSFLGPFVNFVIYLSILVHLSRFDLSIYLSRVTVIYLYVQICSYSLVYIRVSNERHVSWKNEKIFVRILQKILRKWTKRKMLKQIEILGINKFRKNFDYLLNSEFSQIEAKIWTFRERTKAKNFLNFFFSQKMRNFRETVFFFRWKS